MRKIFSRYGFYGALTFFILFSASPFYIMLVTMFKRTHDLFNPNNNPFFFTEPPTLDHVKLLFTQTLFTTFLWNTLLVGIAVVAITVLLAVPAAFSIARMAGRWGESIGIGIFLTYLVPPTLLFIPLADVVADLRLLDTPWALILSYPTILVPFCTWLLMGYFKTIPKELEECARIDGATRFQAFYRIILPLATPGVLSAGIFAFTLSRNEFLFALTFTLTDRARTVPVAIALFRGRYQVPWGEVLAAAVVASVPVAAVGSEPSVV